MIPRSHRSLAKAFQYVSINLSRWKIRRNSCINISSLSINFNSSVNLSIDYISLNAVFYLYYLPKSMIHYWNRSRNSFFLTDDIWWDRRKNAKQSRRQWKMTMHRRILKIHWSCKEKFLSRADMLRLQDIAVEKRLR